MAKTISKILHTTGIQVTAYAVTQRHAQNGPFVFCEVFKHFKSEYTNDDFIADTVF